MTRERALELANDALWNMERLREKALTDCVADAILAAVEEDLDRLLPRAVKPADACKRCQGLRYINPAPFDKCLPCPDCTTDACPNCHAIPPNKHACTCPVAQPLDVVVR